MKLRSGDTEIFYEVRGSGPDVVLLHPFPVNHEFWEPVAGALSQRYRLILPDLRGMGESAPGEGAATMAKHAADVLAVCRDAGVEQAVFTGVSIGGYVLFECWRQFRARFRAMILCNTRAAADTPDGRVARLQAAQDVLDKGPELFLNEMLFKLMGEDTMRNHPEVAARARAMMGRASAAGIAAAQRGMAERPDSTGMLPDVRVPTLIIGGAEDKLTPVADQEAMQRAIPGAKLQVMAKAGHFALFEQPEEAARILRQFLGTLPAS